MPRYGGRQKGTPNKKAITLLEKTLELGIDPFEILLLFAAGDWKRLKYDQETLIEPSIRVQAAGKACEYLHAKRKTIEGKVEFEAGEDRPLKHLTDQELQQLFDDDKDTE